ncbi:U-scoloptoxin(05)-Sm1a [Aplysia californica]|uniref:U-scoloptoxin(05)-Sm1a n=1 Tax=Aplysia californica TaxID=6500 RepID=A0ABM0JYB0_APLCA|nr:U-scoloptoxin(05)-Sm1a [Aplysia californica]
MKFSLQFCAAAFVASFLFRPGAALYCYQCDSTLDSNCQEKWDESLSVNEDKYTLCQLWDAKYCAKVTGMWGGVVGTHRFCSSKDLGDQCQDIWFPDHDRMYRACVYSCSSDGCNAGFRLSSVPVTLLTLMGVVVGVLRLL